MGRDPVKQSVVAGDALISTDGSSSFTASLRPLDLPPPTTPCVAINRMSAIRQVEPAAGLSPASRRHGSIASSSSTRPALHHQLQNRVDMSIGDIHVALQIVRTQEGRLAEGMSSSSAISVPACGFVLKFGNVPTSLKSSMTEKPQFEVSTIITCPEHVMNIGEVSPKRLILPFTCNLEANSCKSLLIPWQVASKNPLPSASHQTTYDMDGTTPIVLGALVLVIFLIGVASLINIGRKKEGAAAMV
ncbi:uncharacterized protein LY89DRAFT_739587 [Mollisia scopiformis]|uniref:Uncharacterized protein n=1 Tax=Mollisia scopiformis TaxID=149040 RepID=A0A194WTV7_MOLSC|nr:uncharacterized protein LY89DRAFT_739587 [Mollisia scopiformis]KUJ11398.1 hypothetical protein LY89DRAFT_739587 [Mollisia scopiformis]